MTIHNVKDKAKLKEGVSLIQTYEAAYQTQREASSALGKAKTKVKNFFKGFFPAENIPSTSSIDIDGIVYSFKASESDILDPRKWYALWQSGEITEDQYFGAVNVVKEEATLAIGEDQALSIQVRVVGKTADVRRNDAEAGQRKGVFVDTPERSKPGIVKRTLPKPEPILNTAPRRLILPTRKLTR